MSNKYVELHDQVFGALEVLHAAMEDLRGISHSVGYLFPGMANDLHAIAKQVKIAHEQLRNAYIDSVDERVRDGDQVSRNLLELAMQKYGGLE